MGLLGVILFLIWFVFWIAGWWPAAAITIPPLAFVAMLYHHQGSDHAAFVTCLIAAGMWIPALIRHSIGND